MCINAGWMDGCWMEELLVNRWHFMHFIIISAPNIERGMRQYGRYGVKLRQRSRYHCGSALYKLYNVLDSNSLSRTHSLCYIYFRFASSRSVAFLCVSFCWGNVAAFSSYSFVLSSPSTIKRCV